MRIDAVEAIALRDVSSYEETTLIIVTADDGQRGFGEAVAHPEAVRAVVNGRRGNPATSSWDMDVQTLLVGADPRDPRRLWDSLKATTFWSCRTGLGHVALAGVEMALWDLAGKIQGVPVWRLLGENCNERLTPYVTVYHGQMPFDSTVATTVATLRTASAAGYRAGKVEALPGNAPSPTDPLTLARAAREALPSDFDLLLDVGYRWRSFEEAEACARALDDLELFALEAPFPPENDSDYRRLARAMTTPIASGDMLSSALEYSTLIGSGVVKYVQAGSGRTGISDLRRLAHAIGERGGGLVPWGWTPTALTTFANVHVAAGCKNVPLIEYADPQLAESAHRLRRELVSAEPAIRDGLFVLPDAPGLGVDVLESAIEAFRIEA